MMDLDAIAGTARAGMLYGIGVGPGDVSYLTLRAAALVRHVDVIAFFAKRGLQGNARGIVAPLLGEHREELRLEYPVTDEIPPDDPCYQEQISRFYEASAKTISALLRQGKSVGLLAEGDPFFYGSFMHIWRRLDKVFPISAARPATEGSSSVQITPLLCGSRLRVMPCATILASHNIGAPRDSACDADAANVGDITTSSAISTMPQA